MVNGKWYITFTMQLDIHYVSINGKIYVSKEGRMAYNLEYSFDVIDINILSLG
jgi:hypothetical protein